MGGRIEDSRSRSRSRSRREWGMGLGVRGRMSIRTASPVRVLPSSRERVELGDAKSLKAEPASGKSAEIRKHGSIRSQLGAERDTLTGQIEASAQNRHPNPYRYPNPRSRGAESAEARTLTGQPETSPRDQGPYPYRYPNPRSPGGRKGGSLQAAETLAVALPRYLSDSEQDTGCCIGHQDSVLVHAQRMRP